jgi:hypothetical protein
LTDYKEAAFKKYGNAVKLITITPFAGSVTGSERSISWSKIKNLLETVAGETGGPEGKPNGIFQQFANCLEANRLGTTMKPDKLDCSVGARVVRSLPETFHEHSRLFERIQSPKTRLPGCQFPQFGAKLAA